MQLPNDPYACTNPPTYPPYNQYSNPTGFVKKGAGDFFRDTQRVPGPEPRFTLRAFTTQIGVL